MTNKKKPGKETVKIRKPVPMKPSGPITTKKAGKGYDRTKEKDLIKKEQDEQEE